MNVSLRLKLIDFLEHEEILIPMISDISKTTQPFPIYFWYEDSADVNSPTFQKFLKDWEGKSGARYKTVIKILDDWKNFAWFDILPHGIELHSRFQYRYKNSGGIILGHWFSKNLGIFVEGNYNKYWNRTWHGFSAGINYRVF